MAQYHFAAKIVCRSKGQSAVAAAAYRARTILADERTAKTFDYSRRRRELLFAEILTPANTPFWMRDREQLWNAVEKAEKRKDSQLARSLDIALPYELSLEHNIELLRGYVQERFVDQGMIADIAIHKPGRTGDIRNVHAHILLTTREIAGPGFGRKARDWNDKKELLEWRKAWADHANRVLVPLGFEPIDHRSLVDQGIDREATTHVGPAGKEMDQRGVPSDRAQKNRDTKSANDNMAALKKELADSENRLAELKRQLAVERMEQIQKTVSAADAVWEQAEQRHAPTQPLQLQGAPSYPGNSAPPVSAGGKAAPMPDDLSEQQKHAAEQDAARQKQAQDQEQARQQKAAEDEQARQKQVAEDEQKKQEAQKQENIRAENKRVEDLAKQDAERQAAQAEEMRKEYALMHSDMVRKSQFDAHNAEMYRRAEESRSRERLAALERQAKEGPIRDAGLRYGQALGQNYDLRDPYGSLAKSAMAEYAAFMRDRQAYDRQIAQTADPIERQALDLRKRIEGADYLSLTGDRIAAQSELITGRRNSEEAVKEREKATNWRIQAQDLRQQLRELHRGPAQEKDRERQRLDEIIKQQDEIRKAKERAKEKGKEKEKEKDKEGEKQQERERKRQRERDRER
jgi:hypothetical protein